MSLIAARPPAPEPAFRCLWGESTSTIASVRALLRNMAHELDCLECGACCRQASDGRILVPAEDIVRWKRAGLTSITSQLVEGHFSEMAFLATAEGACVHLGTPESANACQIYKDRGTTCHDFEKGSWQCHEFRRDAGIEPPRRK